MSKVGAAGVWQFMPGTGRLYMRVDETIDERRDPVIAGRGAARFLRVAVHLEVAPLRDGGFVAPEGERQNFPLLCETGEAFDRNEAVDLLQFGTQG